MDYTHWWNRVNWKLIDKWGWIMFTRKWVRQEERINSKRLYIKTRFQRVKPLKAPHFFLHGSDDLVWTTYSLQHDFLRDRQLSVFSEPGLRHPAFHRPLPNIVSFYPKCRLLIKLQIPTRPSRYTTAITL